MKTPICDFVSSYADSGTVRMHMPGHKGHGELAERLDITEIVGADSLFEANGIIAESEANASAIFGSHTLYSTEGSSLCIRAMVHLCVMYAKKKGRNPLILAGRNAHKSFVSALALTDCDVEWICDCEGSHLSCTISRDDVERRLDSLGSEPVAIYLTSPDYLGMMTDVESIAQLCHERGILLLVDNAHGAHLKFLEKSLHPIDLGADMCADSAHKTLHALTGAAYLHISNNAPSELREWAKDSLSLFASTSPSYLILQSLDRLNTVLSDNFVAIMTTFVDKISVIRRKIADLGYTVIGDDPMRITLLTKEYGYLGSELSDRLLDRRIASEFSDSDHIVFMPSTDTSDDELNSLYEALASIEKRERIDTAPPKSSLPKRAMSPRAAVLSPHEYISVENALGRVAGAITVGCPPAVPIVVSGEVIGDAEIEAFHYYNIKKISAVK